MDRSQQGVCPRTCLSKVPVKPRQAPAPQADEQEQQSVLARKSVPGEAM